MRLFRHDDPPEAVDEDPEVRQYRYLLRTAPADALVAVNAEALGAIEPADRRAVLTTVQRQLVAGGRLTEDHVPALARLVSLGERRQPGAVLHDLEEGTLLRLARAALASESAFGLLVGYADWDGQDPEPPADEVLDKDFGTHWHDARLNPGVAWSDAMNPNSGIGGGDGGAGGW